MNSSVGSVSKKDFLSIFSVVILPMFLAAIDQTLLATATPNIVEDLGGMHISSWIAIGYLLASASSVQIYGWMGDVYGRSRMLKIALVIFAVGSIIGGLAQSMWMLILGRIVQGMAGGGLMSLSQALIGELVPPRERANYQGYFSSMFAFSSISGPVIGGFMVTHLSWQWLFWFNLPLIALAMWRVSSLPTATTKKDRPSVDRTSLVLFPIAMSAVIYWLSSGGHYFPWFSSTSVLLLALFVASLTIFVIRQRGSDAPFIPPELLQVRAIRLPLLASFLFASCMFALAFFLPIYFQVALGQSAADAGLLMIPMSAGIVSGAYLTGKMIARTGIPKWNPVIGMTLCAIMFLIMGLVEENALLLSLLSCGCGFGMGTVMPSTQLTVQTVAGRQHIGKVTSMVSLCRSLGASFGTATFGTLVYSMLPGFGINSSIDELMTMPKTVVVDAFQIGYLVVAGVALLTALVAFRVPLIRLPERE